MMRRFINWLISCYLAPLKLSAKLSLYVKGKILTYDEHYLITLDVIKRKFPADKGVVVDIGAFDGDSTVFLAEKLKHNTILGFEPNPTPYAQGMKNVEPFTNVKLYNLGFSDHVGEVDLHVTKNLVSSSLYGIKDFSEISAEEVIKVKVDTLDHFFESTQEILLIKLDVQGAELTILQQGTETLKKTKLVLTEVFVTEMYEGGCLYYQVDELLRKNNFQVYSIITNYNNEGTKYFDVLYINRGI